MRRDRRPDRGEGGVDRAGTLGGQQGPAAWFGLGREGEGGQVRSFRVGELGGVEAGDTLGADVPQLARRRLDRVPDPATAAGLSEDQRRPVEQAELGSPANDRPGPAWQTGRLASGPDGRRLRDHASPAVAQILDRVLLDPGKGTVGRIDRQPAAGVLATEDDPVAPTEPAGGEGGVVGLLQHDQRIGRHPRPSRRSRRLARTSRRARRRGGE